MPDVWDNVEWERRAKYHASDCEWIVTRAHRVAPALQTVCDHCGKEVGEPESDLYWEYPDWPFSCALVCEECLREVEE